MRMSATDFLSFAAVWRALAPEVILTGAAFLLMIVEFLVPARAKPVVPWLAAGSVVGAGIVELGRFGVSAAAYSTAASAVDGFSVLFKLLILASALLIILLAIAGKKAVDLAYEYSYLLLFATVGAMIVTSATDLITVYVGLELLSVATYVLAALYRKDKRSAEAGLKYLVIGSIASACFLYGLSFLYGLTGTTSFSGIEGGLQNLAGGSTPLLFVALALVLTGLGVKISAVPFHLWTADVYEGAPTPVTAYLAVVSKAAVLGLLLRLFFTIFLAKVPNWWPLVAWLAAVTMIVGNVGALPQKNVKRLLAFSSIGQLGYLLVPMAAAAEMNVQNGLYQGLSADMFYLFAYMFMTVGAFAVFQVVAHARKSEDIEAFAGLWQRSPWLAAAMLLFLVSLAGLPLTGGFVGKILIFLNAWNAGQYWLGIILFGSSVAAFYYYFAIARAMFTRRPVGDEERVATPRTMHAVLVLCMAGTLALGLFPGVLMNALGSTTWLF